MRPKESCRITVISEGVGHIGMVLVLLSNIVQGLYIEKEIVGRKLRINQQFLEIHEKEQRACAQILPCLFSVLNAMCKRVGPCDC